MSLKRNNITAGMLLFLCSVILSISGAIYIYEPNSIGPMVVESTVADTMIIEESYSDSYISETMVGVAVDEEMIIPTEAEDNELESEAKQDAGVVGEEIEYEVTRFFKYFLLIFGVVVAGIICIFIRQKRRIVGLDIYLFIFAIDGIVIWTSRTGHQLNKIMYVTVWNFIISNEFVANCLIMIPSIYIFLLFMRELIGWIFSKEKKHWTFLDMLSNKISSTGLMLAIFVIGLLASWTALLWTLITYNGNALFSLLLVSVIIATIIVYGQSISNLKKQVVAFANGEEIEVEDGMYSEVEQKLVNVHNMHEEAIKKAITSERFRVDLISNVSHDLRTPLTSILGYGELLKSEKLSKDGVKQLELLNHKAGYMKELVENLFEMTNVSSGLIEPKITQIDLIKLLEQTIGIYDDRLHAAGITLCRRYDKEQLSISTDGGRMHQVFANLLGNAIKYALAGSRIHLEVKLSDNEDTVTVRMTNTASYAMDFKPEEIVQRFARGDKARTTPGNGIGLAIAQTYTESVGGAFKVIIDGDQFNAIVSLPLK